MGGEALVLPKRRAKVAILTKPLDLIHLGKIEGGLQNREILNPDPDTDFGVMAEEESKLWLGWSGGVPRKPRGAFWTSTVQSSHGWPQLLERVRGGDEWLAEPRWTMQAPAGMTVYRIDSLTDLETLCFTFPGTDPETATREDWLRAPVDWETLSVVVDAVWLTDNGLKQTGRPNTLSLVGWDCETFCVFRPEMLSAKLV